MVSVTGAPGTRWDQGDVVEEVYFPTLDSECPGILMTPACDLDYDKAFAWTFVALFPDSEIAGDILRREIEGMQLAPDPAGRFTVTKNQLERLRRAVRHLLTNRYPRYQWLSVPIGDAPAHVADFSQVTALPIEEARSLRRICSVRSSWREQVQARYVAYMGRVGTEDVPDQELTEHIDRLMIKSALLAP